MSKKGAPKGNQNASLSRPSKPWTDAIERYAVQNPDKLRQIAEKLFTKALEGDANSVREIGDRLDGKPKQQTEVTGKDGAALFTKMDDDELRAKTAQMLAALPPEQLAALMPVKH